MIIWLPVFVALLAAGASWRALALRRPPRQGGVAAADTH
jgi:hypothetical protein